MATSYPASLDSFTNPTAVDTLDSPPHDTQHADANDAIEALQAKVGVDSSAVTTSLDYRVAQLETGGGGMTVSSTAPSSPAEGDMWYDDTSGRTYVYYDDGSSQQWVEFGAPPSGIGKILQVVSTTKTDTFSASVASGGISGAAISVSITPTSATSKVMVVAQIGGDAGSTGLCIASVLYRDGSALSGALGDSDGSRSRTTSGGAAGADGRIVSTTPIMYLDSPATTSATTYDVRIGHNSASTQTVYLNRSFQNVDSSANWRGISTITLMEVSA